MTQEGFVFGWAYWLLIAVAVQRLAELWRARRNTQRLLARGGHEVGREHYPLIVALHTAWLVMLTLLTAPDPPVNWGLIVVFALLQAMRLWVLFTLGPYWTTRIITLDDAPLARKGPYRFLRHPNYVVVALEIPLLALILNLPGVALAFGGLNLLVLAMRIRIENKALAGRRMAGEAAAIRGDTGSPSLP